MAEAPHILLLEARFYEDIADELATGAIAALEAASATYERLSVPGAFELPAALRMALESGRFDGFVALGCVIRGETSHYDHICAECARGLNALAIEHGIALGFGLLTTENRDQAWDRAAVAKRNKGADAARACLAMMALKRRLGGGAAR